MALFFDQLDWICKLEIEECTHDSGFDTNSCVPAGYYCTNCNQVVFRYMPPLENEPGVIGYESASWAWKFKYGRDWTYD